jgi:hypothetical protein
MNDTIHFILYGILYKIVDDFYDEDIYKEYFPNANIFFYFLISIYTIYLFYFKNTNDDMFIFLFFAEICYVIFLFLNYTGFNDLLKIAEINLSLDDPFTILTLIQLPMFIINFNKMIKENYILFAKFVCLGILIGIIQDVDNSLLGKYILKDKYKNTPHRKKYKFIYRIGLLFLFCLMYKFIITNISIKCGLFFNVFFYILTSICSLYIQIMLEEHKEHKMFIEKVMNIKNTLLQ